MRRKAIVITCCVTGVLAILILLGALLFGIKTVTVEAYPSCSDEQRLAVTETAEYVKGANILFLNEDALAAKIEAARSDLEVIGVERKFPSSVTVHVVPKYEYGYVAASDGYLVVDNDLRVLRKTQERPDSLIELTSNLCAVTSEAIGKPLATEEKAFEAVATACFRALGRLGYAVDEQKADCVRLIGKIEIRLDAAIENQVVTFLFRDGTKMLIYRADDLFDAKVRLAMTAYVRFDEYKGAGNVITAVTEDGRAVVYGPAK